MRKTLHALPPRLASVAHTATVHFRERDALRAVINAGRTPAEMDRIGETLIALLRERGRLGHRDIETELVGDGADRTAARLALKLAWERGHVLYANDSDRWDREVRTFGLAPDGGMSRGLGREEATAALLAAYVDRYGPVSVVDASWWSGLSRSAVLAALATAGTELIEVRANWSDHPQFMDRRQFERFQQTADGMSSTGINLLAHEDVALKAYHQTRRRYLGRVHQHVVFNSIGEARPAVLHDGVVIGTWSWDRRRAEVLCRLVRGTPSAVRRDVRARAGVVTAVLREGLSPAGATSGDSGRTRTITDATVYGTSPSSVPTLSGEVA
jgi:hypothetical protein